MDALKEEWNGAWTSIDDVRLDEMGIKKNYNIEDLDCAIRHHSFLLNVLRRKKCKLKKQIKLEKKGKIPEKYGRGKCDVRKSVQELLEQIWNGFTNENKIPRNYESLILIVFKKAQKTSKRLKDMVTPTLVTQEIRKFAKTKNWRPVRGKEKKKQ